MMPRPVGGVIHFVEGFCMLAVVVTGKYLAHRNPDKAEKKESIPEPTGIRLEKELIQQ